MKIVIAGVHGLKSEQISRLKDLGSDFEHFEDTPATKEEKLSRLVEADVICSETDPIMDVIYDLKDKLICFPFVGVSFLDLDKLAANNVKIANAPGCNKEAVAEWVVAMLLLLSRKLTKYIGIESVSDNDFMDHIPGLAGKKVTILGSGNIGSQVGAVCEALKMNVTYFRRGDDLAGSAKGADYIVNALSSNEGTRGLLDREFLNSLQQGVYFVSITDTAIYDSEALLQLIDSGKIAGAAFDPGGASIFDTSNEFYKNLVKRKNVLATPHIAFHNDMTLQKANDIMIDNAVAWVNDTPKNIVN